MTILEDVVEGFLETIGIKQLGLTPEQVAAANADLDLFIKHLKAIEHGQADVDGGLEVALQDLLNMLKDLGALTAEASVTTSE